MIPLIGIWLRVVSLKLRLPIWATIRSDGSTTAPPIFRSVQSSRKNGQTRATNLEPPVRDRRAAWLWCIRSTRSGIESSSINLDRPGRNRTTHIAISVTYAFPRKSAAESFQRVKNAISDRSTRLCGGSPLELPFLSGHLHAGHEPLGPVGVGRTAALRIHVADTAM